MFVAYYPHLAGLFQREKAGFCRILRDLGSEFHRKLSASNRYGTEFRNETSDQEGFFAFWPADLAGRRTIHKVLERLHRPG
jgi:hypothetical protein